MIRSPGLALSSLLLTTLMVVACMEPPPVSRVEPAHAARSGEGAVVLDWTPPKDRTDGARLKLKDIAQYKIYIGEQPNDYTRVVTVEDASATRHTIGGLKPGQAYYFAITAVDHGGRESPKSGWIRRQAKDLASLDSSSSDARQARQ